MAKSIRSKVKKRFRTAKRSLVDAVIERPRAELNNITCKMISKGAYRQVKKPANAFKYPDSTDAIFPQVEPVKPIDFRSEAIPTAGFATIGNRRKFNANSLAKQAVVPLDLGGSIRGTFASMAEDVQVQHSELKIKAAIPLRTSTLPKTIVISTPRRDRSSRKAQRGSAK